MKLNPRVNELCASFPALPVLILWLLTKQFREIYS